MQLHMMRERQAELKASARALLDSVTGTTPEAEARAVEADFDRLIAEHDRLGALIERHQTLAGVEAKAREIDLSKRPVPPNAGGPAPDLAELRILHSGQTFAGRAYARGADRYDGLDVGGFLRAALTGAQTETEQRALSVGSNSAGGYTVPTILSAQLIDSLRAASVIERAGAAFVPMENANLNISKVLTDPVAGFRVEAGAVAESDPTFGLVSLEPKSLAVLIKVSRELLADSINLARELPALIARAMAVQMDAACLFGTGSSGQPTGLINVSGIGSTSLGGTLGSYAPLVAARTGILSANGGRPSAVIMHPREAGTLAGLTASDGQPLMAPAVIAAIPALETTSVPINGGAGTDEGSIIMGDFSKMLVGVREAVSIQVLSERYADTGQAAFVAHLRFDVACTHAAGFHVIDEIQG